MHNYHDANGSFPPGGSSTGGEGLSYLVYVLPYLEQGVVFALADVTKAYGVAPNTQLETIFVKIYLCPDAIELFAVSFDPATARTFSYAGNMGPYNPANPGQYQFTAGNQGNDSQQGVLGMDTQYRLTDVTDGTSNTFLVGELSWKGANTYRAWSRGCWSLPDGNCHSCKNVAWTLNSTAYNGSNNYNDVSMGSNHTSGANFVLCDGSVRLVATSVTAAILQAVASRNGGEAVSLP